MRWLLWPKRRTDLHSGCCLGKQEYEYKWVVLCVFVLAMRACVVVYVIVYAPTNTRDLDWCVSILMAENLSSLPTKEQTVPRQRTERVKNRQEPLCSPEPPARCRHKCRQVVNDACRYSCLCVDVQSAEGLPLCALRHSQVDVTKVGAIYRKIVTNILSLHYPKQDIAFISSS